MEFFFWNNSFEIGIASIDAQHRRLVDLINALATAIAEGGQLPDVQALFGQLMEYAAIHFSDEERIMDGATLSAEEKRKHRASHQGFVRKAQEFAAHPELLRAEVAENVLEFLTTWLISHILGADKKIAVALADGMPEAVSEDDELGISPVARSLLGALTETERRFRLISDHSPAIMWVADAKGMRGFFNRAWKRYVGGESDAAQEFDWRDHIHPDDRETYLALLERLRNRPAAADCEYRLRRHDGSYAWFLEKILPRIDANDVFLGLIASATDITAIKEAEALMKRANQALEVEVARRTAQLEHLMLTDPLTGIGNRRFVIRRLEEESVRARRYQRPLSAIFIDLDHFKHINDRYGHAMGDSVLCSVAACVNDYLRECDVLGRFGGEEFVALLPETGADGALRVAERMRLGIERLRIPGFDGTVTISAGVAEWSSDGGDEALIRRSDKALYLAKEAGRNCCRVERGA